MNKTLRANFNLQHESLIVEKPDCGIKVYAVEHRWWGRVKPTRFFRAHLMRPYIQLHNPFLGIRVHSHTVEVSPGFITPQRQLGSRPLQG